MNDIKVTFTKEEPKRFEEMILMENENEMEIMHKLGFKNTIYPMGLMLKDEQAWDIAHKTDNIILMFRQDKAGLAAEVRAYPYLKKKRLLVWKTDRDFTSDELLTKSPSDMALLLSNKRNLIEEIIDLAFCSCDGSSDDMYRRAKKLMPFVAASKSAIERGYNLRDIANAFSMTHEQIDKMYKEEILDK